MLRAQPAGGTQLPAWGEGPPRLRAALGQSCLTREKRRLGAPPALSLSLPAAQPTRRSQESPSDASAVAQTPPEGAEPPPCRECLSGAGSVPEHCSSSRAAEALLLTFLHSFSLAQWRTLSARSVERLMEGQAEVRMAASALPLAVPGCQGCAASGVSLCGRYGGSCGGTRGAERVGEPPGTAARPRWQLWEERCCAGQRGREGRGSQLWRAQAAGAGWQLGVGVGDPCCCGAAI